jgi:enoyl-CoA hydratase
MPYVVVEDPRPHIRVIRLNRPERMNAMSFDVMVPVP